MDNAELDSKINEFKQEMERKRSAGEMVTGIDIINAEKELTKSIGERIKSLYQAIEDAIAKLDIADPDMPKKKQDLLELKPDVPRKFAITKDDMVYLNDALNAILGPNISEND